MTFKPGDVVCFNDEWFQRRRLPIPPLEERNPFTVRVVGEDRVLVDVLEEGKLCHQVIVTNWLELLTEEAPPSQEGDVESIPT